MEKAYKRTTIYKLYDSVKQMYKYKCAKCGGREYLEIHHIIPRTKGGKDEKSNLVLVCSKCHLEYYHAGNWSKTNKDLIIKNGFCKACGYTWEKRIREPKQCPRCKTRLWERVMLNE